MSETAVKDDLAEIRAQLEEVGRLIKEISDDNVALKETLKLMEWVLESIYKRNVELFYGRERETES